MHASAVRLEGSGLLAVGRTGTGKSTLAVGLSVDARASLVSDDTVWLERDRVAGFGAPVTLRPGNPYWDVAAALWYGGDAERLVVRVEDLGGSIEPGPMPVDVIAFPRFTAGSPASTVQLRPSTAIVELMGAVTGRVDAGPVEHLAELAGRVPAVYLTYPDAATAHNLCREAVSQRAEHAPVEHEHVDVDLLARAGLNRHARGIRFGEFVVLWSARTGKAVELAGWTGESLTSTEVYPELVRVGLAVAA